jgi:hypothetical protein
MSGMILMNYVKLMELVNNTIKEVFLNDINKISETEKAFLIYKKIVEETAYDFELLESRKKRGPVNLLMEVFDVFINKKGVCSSLSQAYKLLLEQVGIEAKAVICDDGNEVLHQLLIIKENENDVWYFSDVTRGILYKNEGLSNFLYGYERCNLINQKMLGCLPECLYDAVYNRETKKSGELEKLNSSNLCDLPTNIILEDKSNNIKV